MKVLAFQTSYDMVVYVRDSIVQLIATTDVAEGIEFGIVNVMGSELVDISSAEARAFIEADLDLELITAETEVIIGERISSWATTHNL